MKMIICAKCYNGSGNMETARYIENLLSDYFADVITLDVNKPDQSPTDLTKSTQGYIAILIHLKRCHEFCKQIRDSIPIIAICGGTDLNEDVKSTHGRTLMNYVVKRSRAVVVFSQSMLNQFNKYWPNYSGIVKLIPHGVTVDVERAKREKHTHLSWLQSHLGCHVERFFLIAGRLRPVKSPQYALNPFLEWNAKGLCCDDETLAIDPELRKPFHHHLIYIGSVEENTLEIELFLNSLKSSSGNVHHINSIEKPRLHAIMLSADALINCSLSEGQSLTIMEAMHLGTPVIARSNCGNCDLIQHEVNGLVFNTTEELKSCLTKVVVDQDSRTRMIQAAYDCITDPKYDPLKQAEQYAELIDQVRELSRSSEESTTFCHGSGDQN